MTSLPPPDPPRLGPLFARLRLARGWSQRRLAAELCAVSGQPTLSRHEISRWERQLRVPGGFWLGWLAVVLAVPLDVLVGAAARTRRTDPPRTAAAAPAGRSGPGRDDRADRGRGGPTGSRRAAAGRRPAAGRPARGRPGPDPVLRWPGPSARSPGAAERAARRDPGGGPRTAPTR
ncbi:helix-turn-helix domain-containing protein [Micromonospora endolithica]|uniref:XRE family transcriptional regulator n=1 Tax=Micromonospora endolithica TaxID=230091 RepID=A0A3A9ZT85_9ACTN|nr:helix-turn-helix transcriptional regulator [Micromonospora endolithica]RKN50816.1 XRE family transcriptional regulator [Micromonospora endolithica]TWJ20422.1 helix-turn-helix protein [Micromonospora endolithica]